MLSVHPAFSQNQRNAGTEEEGELNVTRKPEESYL